MITLTMERLDHAVVLKLPTEHEHVMVALWRLGLNRDPHMYTLGDLNAVFSYDTPEEHQMVRLIDMNNSLHFALCSLHEMLAPPVPYAQQLRKKLQSGSYRSAKDFYMYLSDRANKENTCWPSIPTISKDLKLSESTTRRALSDLRKAGLVHTEQRYRENGGNSSLLYHLV